MKTHCNNTLHIALALMLFTLFVARADEGWTISPEMRLPALPETTTSVVKTAARFDFENSTDGWRARHPEVSVERIETAGKTGKAVLRIRGREPSNWNFAASPEMQLEPGKRYNAAMWIRIESMPEGSRPVFFKVEYAYDNNVTNGRVSSPPVPPEVQGQWYKTEIEFQAPTNCHRAWAAIEKGTASPSTIDISVDEFVLQEIGESSLEAGLRKGELAGPITKELMNVHPRIYLTARALTNLKARVLTDPRWKWAAAELFRIADLGIRVGPPDYDKEAASAAKAGGPATGEQLWQRPVGNMIPHLALAYLLSNNAKYLDAARQWIKASLSYKTWGLGSIDGLDLAAGHQLAGLGIAYDWLYGSLTADERASIREGLAKRGGAMARAMVTRHIWWQNHYMQNHLWVNSAGLATAGFAVCDEVDEARGWVRLVHDKILTTLAMASSDGASHEGYGYWEYGVEYVMRYAEMARDLMGIDLYRNGSSDQPWLAQSPLYALYLAPPVGGWTRNQSIVDIGDCPRNHWYGPSYILNNLARRYPGSPNSGIAQWLASQVVPAGVDAGGNGHYLNFAWYEPDMKLTTPQTLPTLHHFTNMGIVSARSDWSGTGSFLVVKCGPPLGHSHVGAPYDYGSGHVHPDAGHFIFYSRGQFLMRDDGYVYPKFTANHNSVLIDGNGQKGESKAGYDFSPWLTDRRTPRVLAVTASPTTDVIVCDAAPAYPADLGLTRFIRTFLFHKPDRLEIQDELAAARPAVFQARFHADGQIEKVADRTYRLTSKEATALFTVDKKTVATIAIEKSDTGEFLSLTSPAPEPDARFLVVITAADTEAK